MYVERFKLPVGAPALARIRKGETGAHVLVEGFEPRKKKGAARGQRNRRSKLKPEQVQEIRRRGDAGDLRGSERRHSQEIRAREHIMLS